MAKNSIILLTSTAGQLNVTGPAVKFAGYFGYSRGIGTVSFAINNFTGRIFIEVSLATNPLETPTYTDWFPIWLEGLNPYVQFPLDPNSPTGIIGDSGNYAYTFQGNLVWVRARVDRSYITLPILSDLGTVQQILLNY